MEKLVIDRTKWLRGEGSEASRLLRPSDGKMCCLGFYSLSCGLTDKDIQNIPAAPEIAEIPEVMDWLIEDCGNRIVHSDDAAELMDYNDTPPIRDTDREAHITEIFAKHGIEVEFIN